MISDLESLPAANEIRTEVAIIGAGIAGLLLANRLRERGVSVVVLESGGQDQSGDAHPLNEVEIAGSPYGGASRGRARCLGGTSTLWGGAMLPFFPEDLGPRPHVGIDAWPVSMKELRPGLGHIEALFGLDPGSFEEDFIARVDPSTPTGDSTVVARYAKWPAFGRRNVARLLRGRLIRDQDLLVVVNATVVGMACDPATHRVVSLEALSMGRRRLVLRAERFVLCAGAIENTRLLLIAQRDWPWLVPAGDSVLGRWFHDHLSARVARFPARSVPSLNRLAGFRFVGSTMRSLRFELQPAAQAREKTPSMWAHIAAETEGATALDTLREILRGVQKGRAPRGVAIAGLARHTPYLARMAWWRVMRRQLRWPEGSRATLHLVVEQLPSRDNQIRLSEKTDCFGRPLALIDWRVSPMDRRAFLDGRRIITQYWSRTGLAARAPLEWVDGDSASVGSEGWVPGDVFHPGGTTRMGADARSAVLDADLRVHGAANLYAASTAAFPAGAGANPTLMLMLFAHRLAEHLASAGHQTPD